MTTKAYQARQPVRTLAPVSVADRALGTLNGTSMGMQTITRDMLGPGVGLRTASLLVAASDASVSMKALADYVCDGVADDVEISAAMGVIGSTGGTVQLSEGTFTLALPLVMAAANLALRGMGIGATTLFVPNNAPSALNTVIVQMSANDQEVSDLTINVNRQNNTALPAQSTYGMQATGVRSQIRRVRVLNAYVFGIVVLATAVNSVVRDCLVEASINHGMLVRGATNRPTLVSGCTVKSAAGVGFNFDSGPVLVSDCAALGNTSAGFWISSADTALTNCVAESNSSHGFYSSGARTKFVACRASSNSGAGILLAGVQGQAIGCVASNTSGSGYGLMGDAAGQDLLFVGCSAFDNANGFVHAATGSVNSRAHYVGCRAIGGSYGFRQLASREMHVHGCYIGGSVYGWVPDTNAVDGSLNGSRIVSCQIHGVRVVGPANTNHRITNNYFYNSSTSSNNGGWHCSSSGTANYIAGNVFRDPPSGNRPYGALESASDSVNNVHGFNDAFGSGLTAQISDNTAGKLTRRPAKLQLDYTLTSNLGGTALGNTTWTPFGPTLTFKTESSGSAWEVTIRGSIAIGTSAPAEAAVRVVIDGTAYPLTGETVEIASAGQNMLSSPVTLKFAGWTPGTRTLTFQGLVWGQTGTAYLNPIASPSTEALGVQVVEYLR